MIFKKKPTFSDLSHGSVQISLFSLADIMTISGFLYLASYLKDIEKKRKEKNDSDGFKIISHSLVALAFVVTGMPFSELIQPFSQCCHEQKQFPASNSAPRTHPSSSKMCSTETPNICIITIKG